MDRLEKIVSYNGGALCAATFFNLNKELEVKGHARDSFFYTRTSGRSSECGK